MGSLKEQAEVERSHKAAIACWEPLAWLANVAKLQWHKADDEAAGEQREQVVVGARKAVERLRESYAAGCKSIDATSEQWILAADGVVKCCGESAPSAHHLAVKLAGKALVKIGFRTRTAIQAEALDPAAIDFAEALPAVCEAAEFLDLPELETLADLIRRERVRATTVGEVHLTEPMTRAEIGRWFSCHRNQVERSVLAKYPHEKNGSKIRMHAKDMPAAYHAKHGR